MSDSGERLAFWWGAPGDEKLRVCSGGACQQHPSKQVSPKLGDAAETSVAPSWSAPGIRPPEPRARVAAGPAPPDQQPLLRAHSAALEVLRAGLQQGQGGPAGEWWS